MEKVGGRDVVPMNTKLGGGFKHVVSFHPDPWGNDPVIDEHIFQRGWSNHQLETYGTPKMVGF